MTNPGSRGRVVTGRDAEREQLAAVDCPGRFALCGVPCGCNGQNPSHRLHARAALRASNGAGTPT